MIDKKDLAVGKKFALAKHAAAWGSYHEDLPYVTIDVIQDSLQGGPPIIYVKEFTGWITMRDLDYLYTPYTVEDWTID